MAQSLFLLYKVLQLKSDLLIMYAVERYSLGLLTCWLRQFVFNVAYVISA